jgi:hydroxymethylpyrimidine pyrophosphatase-like HAD family hydrolase
MPTSDSWLLASDMDGTVIPLDRDPVRADEIARFRRAVQDRPGLVLAYVSGRDLGLALQGIDVFRLPLPDFIAADVGSRVYRRHRSEYVPDPDYDARMTEAVGGVDLADVGRVVEELPEVRLQPEERQGRFKRSFFVVEEAALEDLMETVRERVAREGARVSLIHSHDPLTGLGLLDLLPADSAKDTAVRHLAELADTPVERVAYAGDSGNDLAAFLGGFAGIVVGNAPQDLKDRLRAARDQAGEPLRLHFAEARFAAGVLEGLQHFGVVPRT